jgi:CBS-domain-containing membrane protein
MIADVHTITVDMTIKDAIGKVLKHKISGAPVVDSVKNVISVISQGDLMKLAATKGLTATIGTVLQSLPPTNKLITSKKATSFAEIYKMFLAHPVHRIIIVDGSGKLQGIVSRSTVLGALYAPAEEKKSEEAKPTEEKAEKKAS